MSGGVQWLGRYCSEQFGRDFLEFSPAQQTQVLDKLAYRKRVPPDRSKHARSSSWYVALLAMDFIRANSAFQELGYKGKVDTQPRPAEWIEIRF